MKIDNDVRKEVITKAKKHLNKKNLTIKELGDKIVILNNRSLSLVLQWYNTLSYDGHGFRYNRRTKKWTYLK